MDHVQSQYQLWSSNPFFDWQTREELLAIADQPQEIEDRFYRDLAFGTAGLRGVIGAGTNRMNRYTVVRAADGFARYIASLGTEAKQRGVVISYDSRRFSDLFARLTAAVMIRYGIRTRLSDILRPVPVLSYAIRHYQAVGGIMITASHNPAQYNGFKAYGGDGGQLPPEAADQVSAFISTVQDWTQLNMPDETSVGQSDLFAWIGDELDQAYDDQLKKLIINHEAIQRQADMKIVFTPLHGAGSKPVRRILRAIGFRQVQIVPEQQDPDPDFSTVASPNPEDRAALAMAIQLAEKNQADIVIATDPDGDRTGLAVRDADGRIVVLSGNQIGILLTDYILSAHQKAGTMPENPFVVTTIVSTKLMRRIAAHYHVSLFECLTGFKFIAELIQEKDELGDMHYLFGFEESFGYLAGTEVRDKDAVVTSMLIAEMAAAARDQNQTLYEKLDQLYQRFGYAAEQTLSIVMEGKEGLEAIEQTMDTLRRDMKRFAQMNVSAVNDYDQSIRTELMTGEKQRLDFPRSNVLLYELDDLDWFCVRPSGTEPKIKIYFGCYDSDPSVCESRMTAIRDLVEKQIRNLLTGDVP
jgi:phosphoglucomutase